MVSVIVPVYNAEKTLRECVDSILCQDYKDFELLLIDDGSKDVSPTICDDYAQKDRRVKVFHKSNGGVSSARNLGIDNAQGEWITFVDSDDYITRGYFNGIDEHDEDILIKGYKKFCNTGIEVERFARDLINLSVFSDLISMYITDSLLRGPVFKFYKKELIGDLRFMPDMKIGEDAWFVFNYLAKCRNYAIVLGGDYVVRLAEEPDEIKYAISVDYAIQSLNYLKDAFEGLVNRHHIDRSLFFHYIGYFKRISKSDWKDDKSKWYGNSKIKALYQYVWPSLSLNQKLRLSIAKLIKR